MHIHIEVWLAAASLHESGHVPFSPARLRQEVTRLFQDTRPGVQVFISAHANASGPKNDPTVYNYVFRTADGALRLCRTDDQVHPSRAGARRWPDQAVVPQEYWPLWHKWSAWQAAPSASASGASPLTASMPETSPVAEVAASVQEEPDGDFHSRLSTYREAMLEHLLIGELMRYLWPTPLEVCKPQVDAAGYDLILQCQGVLRHVQLKTSVAAAATNRVDVHVQLAQKPGACVIWTRFDPQTLTPKGLWWFEPQPELAEAFKVARHSRGNALGKKSERPMHRVVPASQFTRLNGMPELVARLFGIHADTVGV